MNPPIALPLFIQVTVGIGLVALAGFVARTGWQQGHNRTFAALYFLSGAKSVSEGLLSAYSRSGDGTIVQSWAGHLSAGAPLFPGVPTWQAINVACAFFMVPLLLAFILEFPRPWPPFTQKRWMRAALFAPSVLSLAIYFLRPWAFHDDHWLTVYFVGFELVATAVTLVALYRLFLAREQAKDDIARKQATYLLAGFFPAFAATWVLTFNDVTSFAGHGVDGLGVFATDWLAPILSPPLELIAAGAVAYAILKYRLLAFELKVKGGAKFVLLTAFMGTMMFAINTYVGNFVLQGQVFAFAGPTWSAIFASITTVLLFKPLDKLATRLTDRLFPETRQQDYPTHRAEEIYQAQASLVLGDAQVTAREIDFLRRLRLQLAITDTRAQAIEESVERSLGVDTELGQAKAA